MKSTMKSTMKWIGAAVILVGAALSSGAQAANKANKASSADKGPSDMQIAHIAYTAGVLDIRYAHLALAKSDNAQVREFAELMIRDHTSVNDQAVALLTKLGATPEDNATSQQLAASAKTKREQLAALDGAAFDRAYAENELAYHQFVNKTVETTFIPSADNKEFKALLKSALGVFKIHEGHAAGIVKSLN